MGMALRWRILVMFALGYIMLTLRILVWHQDCAHVDPEADLHITRGRDGTDEPEDEIRLDNQDFSHLAARTAEPKKGPDYKEFIIDTYDHQTRLDPNFAPNTVHYVWCGKRWFEFTHYLSVMSVIKEIRPDLIIFHHDYLPIIDYWLYNTWFDELQRQYPFIRLQVAPKEACLKFRRPNTTYVYQQMTYHGGIFVNEHTLMLRFPIGYRNYTFIKARDGETGYGFLLSKIGYPGKLSLTELRARKDILTTYLRCLSYRQLTQLEDSKFIRPPICIDVDEAIFPKDIWDLDNDFGRAARRIFYGTPNILRPVQNYDVLIPNIAHMVWLGGGEMDFLFYLSVLSLLYVVKVDALYIHGDYPPTGHYWQKVKSEPRLHNIFRESPQTVYGTRVNVLSHVTDIWRVDFMIHYGGIYVDTDTVFVKPLDRDIRAYDAVASYDWTYWNPPFPDTINFGVTIGKKNATFWHEFQKSMSWFIDKDWSWNGLRQPYRIKERHPELLLVDPRLQVICYQAKCHPTWHPQYHNESIHHLNDAPIKDWRNDVYAFHWTLPTPYELLNEKTLYSSQTMFAEIGKFILSEAGIKPPAT